MFPYDDARFAAYLRRLTGAKGVASLTQLLDVMPVVSLAGDRPEDAYLRDERLLFSYIKQAASVGNFSQLLIENPVGSGVLAVVEQLHLHDNNAFLTIIPGLSIGSGGSQVQPRDTRVGNSVGLHTRLNLRPAAAAVPNAGASSTRLVHNIGNIVPPFVLRDGSTLVLESGAANLDLAASCYWREMPVPPPNR